METNKVLVGLLVAILILNVVMVGLYFMNQGFFDFSGFGKTSSNQSANVSVVLYKNCSELKGDECSSSEKCTGSWVDSSDTFSCCSSACAANVNEDIIAVETFNNASEEESLGEII